MEMGMADLRCEGVFQWGGAADVTALKHYEGSRRRARPRSTLLDTLATPFAFGRPAQSFISPAAMQPLSVNEYLRQHIRTVPDWPAPGVQFRDITPLLQDPKVFRVLIDAFVHRYMDKALRPDVVAGLDARGFILGAVVAYELNVGFVPIRKKGKLPFTTVEETYELEYGSATVELHTDAVKAGDRVLLIDDLIATGGTMMAGRKLLEKLGATVTEGAAIVDLPELGGSRRLRDSGLPLYTLVDYEGH
jgi:adenine phosphoribosyltransferase